MPTITFGCRAEAQWGRFLDRLGIQFYYRPETFDCDGVSVTPTFYLPELGVWLDYHAHPSSENVQHIEQIARETEENVFLAWGSVASPSSDEGNYMTGFEWRDRPVYGLYGDFLFAWARCPVCKQINIALLGRADKLRCGCCRRRKVYGDEARVLLAAYRAAQNVRTEQQGREAPR